jgi:hypothetical protein
MGELIKIILFVYAVYFVLKSVARFLFPFLFSDFQRSMNGQNRNQFKKQREGEVTIEHKGSGKKGFDKNIGEYIDYEEIKD